MNRILKKFLPEQLLPYLELRCEEEDEGIDPTFEPKEGIIIHYIDVEGAETLIDISAYEGECEEEEGDDGLSITTEQGIEYYGEYEIDSPISLDQFRVYKEVPLDE